MNKESTTERAELPADVSRLRGWRRARNIAHPVTTKVPTRRVTINLDEDIVAIFKAEALQGGPPYQVAINQALRSYLRDRQRSEREQAVDLVLKALEDRTVVKRLRQLR
jgi:uncharacterized protein (DUF4415 family)